MLDEMCLYNLEPCFGKILFIKNTKYLFIFITIDLILMGK